VPQHTDCVARIRYLREHVPGIEFSLERHQGEGLFVIRAPGHDEPFTSRSLCDLAAQVETWLCTQTMTGLLSGKPG